MADLIALVLMCLALPAAGAAMLRLWQTRTLPPMYSGLTVGQIPQRLRRRASMAVRRAGGAA